MLNIPKMLSRLFRAFTTLAEGDFQGAIIEPVPLGGQARDQRPIFIKLHEVLEDVKGDEDPVLGVLIHNPQFRLRRGDLLSHTTIAPPKGGEHQDDASNDELFRG